MGRSTTTILAALWLLAAPLAAEEPTSQSLETLLGGRGWVGVQLRQNAFSQLETDVVVNGEHRFRAQISTSFSNTILDQKLIEGLGLEVTRTQIEVTGAKGKQRLGSVALQTLAFDEASVGPLTVFTAELDELITRPDGVEPLQVVIGSDFLTRYQAVLDISASRLYLRVN